MLGKFASNALANLTTGVSGTIFQIGLTAVATRSFGKEGFAIWALGMSMAAWVPLFSANLSIIVTRRLVEEPTVAPALMHASKGFARQLSLLAVVVILLISAGLLHASKPLANVAATPFLGLVLLLTLSQIWQVLLQPSFGECFAHERNWQVARVIVLSRVVALIGLVLFWWMSGTKLEVAAFCLLAGTLIGLALGRGGRGVTHLAPSSVEVESEQKLIRPLLGAFAIWSIGSAVIQSGLPAFMSLIAPDRFNAFFLAYTLNMVVVGTIGAASGALLAPLAKMRADGRLAQLVRWLTFAPAFTGATLLSLMLMVWYALPWVLAIWSADVATAQEVRRHLFWLSIQTMVRSMCLVYSVVLSSAGNPSQLRRPILVELGIAGILGLPIGWWLGDSAFLCALSAAGWITSIFTCLTTLQLKLCDRRTSTKLVGAFIASQVAVVVLWTISAH